MDNNKIYLIRGNDTPLSVCLRKSEGEGDPVPYDLSTAERMRLALVGHGMHIFAEDIEISGEDNNIISGVIPGRSLLKGDYDLEVTFNLDGRDKRFAINDMFEAVDFLAEDADGEAEGEGAGIFVTVTVQPELIEISGPTGPKGKSAYRVWLDDGHTGTEDDFFEWLAAQTPNPDWNQNDSTEADFIKNRTHWEEESTTTIPDAKLAWSGSTPEDLDFWFPGTNVHIPRTSTGWGLTWQGGEMFIDDNGFGYELGVYNGEEWSINPFDPSYDQQPYPLNVDVVITSGTTVHKLDNKFLDMDSEPTTGSGKPVTSGGVKAAIADFITRAVNDLLNYYTKTETYTKAEVNQLVAGINNWEIVPVAQLPEASADTMHKIYLVPSSNPKTRNVKDEFITVEVSGAYSWEQIGTTAIDLTNYVTKQDLTEALADYVTSTAFTQALATKQDVISDLPQIREGASNNVKYTSQSLTEAQKGQARTNIGAASESEVSQLRSEGLGLLNLTHLVDAGAIVMENGSISTTTGANSTSGTTIRTKDAFRTPDTIAAPDGYVVARIFYYNSWTDISNFTFDSTVQVVAKGATLDKSKPFCRVTFNAVAGGNITWPAFVDSIYLVSRKITSLQNRVFGDTEFSLVGYINASTGAFVPGSSAWCSTDFIPVNEGDNIEVYSSAAGSADAAFYKEDKTFLSAIAGTAVGTKTITAPAGARWYRCANAVGTCPVPYTNVKSIVYERLVAALNKTAPTPVPTPTPVKLFDSINKPIVFNGKTIRAFGDSITWGVSSPNLTPAGDDRYISRFAAHVGATLYIHAESGSTLTTGNGTLPSIYTKITSINSPADIIWVMGGVNDWQKEVAVGDFSDNVTTTVYGAMNAICSYIKTTWPNASVIFVTPIPTTSLTAFGSTHPDNLDDYRKAIQEVAAANGFNVVNGAGLGLPNETGGFGDFMCAPTDCIHPTIAGHAMLARSLAGKLL